MKKNIKHFVVFISLIFITINIEAQTTNWKVEKYVITFKIKNAKLPVSGNFSELDAQINFNPLSLQKSNITAKIKVNTIKTGIEMRDKHLKKAEFFDAVKFPEITIVTTSITKINDNEYNAKCNLTIKGKTKEVNMPFTFIEKESIANYAGKLLINRLDFGVGSPSVIMAKDLEVTILVTAQKNK